MNGEIANNLAGSAASDGAGGGAGGGIANWHAVDCDAYGRLNSLMARSGPPTKDGARRILVPIDGSATALGALQIALRMADGPLPAEIHLLNVQIVLGAGERDDTLLRQGLADTWTARAAIDGTDLPYVLRLVVDHPPKAIASYARDNGIDEIVMGTDGAGRVASSLLGSVAADVLEKVALPVTLIKPGCRAAELPGEWVDWLLACDGSPAALAALRYVLAQLALRPRGPRVHLLNVRSPEGMLISANPTPAEQAELRALASAECSEALAILAAADIPHELHVGFGDPVEQILGVAERLGCGHIAMGTRGLGWLGSLLLGSVSTGVIRRATLPVTLVKDE